MSGSHDDTLSPSGSCGCHRGIFAKKWKKKFSKERRFNEDRPSIVHKRRNYELPEDDNGIRAFLDEGDEPVPRSVVDKVAQFCGRAVLQEAEAVIDDKSTPSRASLDDRSQYHVENCSHQADPEKDESGGCVRTFKTRLLPIDLYRALREPRYDIPDTPNADRRLIHIENLTPEYVLALIETASFHQIPTLRDAIFQHLNFKPSIRIRIPSGGFPIFQLEFHMPYLAFRPVPPPNDAPPRPHSKFRGSPIDVSFLMAHSPNQDDEQKYAIYEAQVSLVICGSDEWRYVAYSFADTYFDEEEEEEIVYGENFDPCKELIPDPIASDHRIDANKPIWNPRAYFLAVCNVRMKKVLVEWQDLHYVVQESIRQYEERQQESHYFTDIPETNKHRIQGAKNTDEWTLNMRTLICQLQNQLSSAVQAWTSFSDLNKDILCFSDLISSKSSRRVRWALHEINENFDTLKGIEQDFLRWEKYCEGLARNLELRLTRESNKVARRRTEMTLTSHEAAMRNHRVDYELAQESFHAAQRSIEVAHQSNKMAHQSIATTELTAWITGSIALVGVYFSLPEHRNGKALIIGMVVVLITLRSSFNFIGILLRPKLWPYYTQCEGKVIEWLGNLPWYGLLGRPKKHQKAALVHNSDDLELAALPIRAATESTLVDSGEPPGVEGALPKPAPAHTKD